MKKNFISSLAVLLAIVLVFGAAIYGLDTVTNPIIEKNKAARATGAYAEVLPGGVVFEAKDMSVVTLPEPDAEKYENASILGIYEETSGLGFVVELATTSKFSENGQPLKILMGIDATGAIAEIKITEDHETKPMPEAFVPSFKGQNSTLADVDLGLATGTTFTAKAFRGAVAYAFDVLALNNFVAETKKSDEQVLKELIPAVHTGLLKSGNPDVKELPATGNIVSAMQGGNGSSFAYIVNKGESKVLAVVNGGNACKVYDLEGADITADCADIIAEVSAHAIANRTDTSAKDMDALKRLVGSDTATAVSMEDIFSTVSAIYDLGNGNYGFVARPHNNYDYLYVYCVLDANGAIVKMNATEFIIEEAYFNNFGGMDTDAYREGFVGLTKDTFTKDVALIATATMTSDAMEQATNDIFAAFDLVKGGA